jgi:hypothetical protein
MNLMRQQTRPKATPHRLGGAHRPRRWTSACVLFLSRVAGARQDISHDR